MKVVKIGCLLVADDWGGEPIAAVGFCDLLSELGIGFGVLEKEVDEGTDEGGISVLRANSENETFVLRFRSGEEGTVGGFDLEQTIFMSIKVAILVDSKLTCQICYLDRPIGGFVADA